MTTEQNKTLEGLQMAIRMEIDGKTYYQKTSQESSNELGKQLLLRLSVEEDIHRQKFEEIFKAIQQKKAWPKTDFRPDIGKQLTTIFASATEKLGKIVPASSSEPHRTELHAIQTAMDMENITFDFYKQQSKNASFEAERGFYETVAGEESKHHQVLLDYYEYLKNPASWFVKAEHHSLDGG